MSYLFTCSNGHTSHSASKTQRDPSCPECGEPTTIVPDEKDVRELLNPAHAETGKRVLQMKEEGYSNEAIASDLGVHPSSVRQALEGPDEIQPRMIMWYPGPDYTGREGNYAKTVGELEDRVIIEMVQARAVEDGEWTIQNGLVAGKERLMNKMMAWAGDPKNIAQCLERVYAEENAHIRTVDWVCRELAQATQAIGRGDARD